MDITSLIGIIIVIAVIYFIIRFIVSPVIKVIVSVVVFLLLVFLLQRFFGFDIDKVLAQFGVSLNLNGLSKYFNWILEPMNYYMDQIRNLFNFSLQNIPKK